MHEVWRQRGDFERRELWQAAHGGWRWAIVDASGEVYAIARDREERIRLLSQSYRYLHEAEVCGHPDAPAWVRDRLPVRAERITPERAAELREDATPVLEREP